MSLSIIANHFSHFRFRVAVTDETWFLTIIYCSARHLALTRGDENPQYATDADVLMETVLRRLGKSVADAGKGEVPMDAIICAVSCLTTLEVCSKSPYCSRCQLINNSYRMDWETKSWPEHMQEDWQNSCERKGDLTGWIKTFNQKYSGKLGLVVQSDYVIVVSNQSKRRY